MEPFVENLYFLCRHETLCKEIYGIGRVCCAYGLVNYYYGMAGRTAVDEYVAYFYLVVCYEREFFFQRQRACIVKDDVKVLSECWVAVVFPFLVYP